MRTRTLALLPDSTIRRVAVTPEQVAAWDVVHYRRNIVVNRSLALWCIGLDVFLGVACIVLAITA